MPRIAGECLAHVLLSVLFYECKWAHGCQSARSWMAPVLLHVLLRCHSSRSWTVPRRHPSTRSWMVACGRTQNIFRMYEFICTRCSLADHYLFFLPVTSTTNLRQPVECGNCAPMLLSMCSLPLPMRPRTGRSSLFCWFSKWFCLAAHLHGQVQLITSNVFTNE